MTTDTRTARITTVAGLLTGAIGIAVAKVGGMEMPPIPPGAVLLVAGALLVSIFRQSRWPGFIAVLVALAEVVPSALTLDNVDGAGQMLGTTMRLAGAVIAVIGGVAILVTTRKRTVHL